MENSSRRIEKIRSPRLGRLDRVVLGIDDLLNRFIEKEDPSEDECEAIVREIDQALILFRKFKSEKTELDQESIDTLGNHFRCAIDKIEKKLNQVQENKETAQKELRTVRSFKSFTPTENYIDLLG